MAKQQDILAEIDRPMDDQLQAPKGKLPSLEAVEYQQRAMRIRAALTFQDNDGPSGPLKLEVSQPGARQILVGEELLDAARCNRAKRDWALVPLHRTAI